MEWGIQSNSKKSMNNQSLEKLHVAGTANRSLRRAQPSRISKDGIALGLRSQFGEVGLLSLFLK